MQNEEIKKFVKKVNDSKKDNQMDLSMGEDLSVALMNLISIEEHFFFTGQKTNDAKYLDLLKETRTMRTSLMKKLIKDPEGEVWCISKHLLAASMRVFEVGTKLLGQGKNDEANEMFEKSYNLYNLFWGINLDLIETGNIQEIEKGKIDKKDTTKKGVFGKLGDMVKKAVDCCIE